MICRELLRLKKCSFQEIHVLKCKYVHSMDDVRNFAKEEYDRSKEKVSMRMVRIKVLTNFDDIQGKQEDSKGRLCNEFLRFCKSKFLKNHMQCPEAHSI